MYHSFPYKAYAPIIIPEENLQGVFEYPQSEPVKNIQEELEKAINNPIGCNKLENLAKGKNYAIIIVDAVSETIPVKKILTLLCAKLEQAEVKTIKILLSVAGGEPFTAAEKKEKFGKDIFTKYEIKSHRFKDHLSLVDLGYNSFGSRVYLNSTLLNADLVIGIGQIIPHRTTGFSGGSECILPGVSGSESISKITWDSATLPTEKVFGCVSNPIRQEMNECAEIAGLSFIINTVPNPEGKICHIVAGDYIKAFEKGCEYSKSLYGAQFLRKSDITITDAFPYDDNLWQASRALFSAELMTNPGGVIIFISPCHEGVSKSHKFIETYGYKTVEETLADFSDGLIPSFATAAHCLRMGRIIRDSYTCFMPENAINSAIVTKLGFKLVHSAQEALEKAFFLKGKQATVSVLKKGGDTLPINILK